MSKTHSPNCQCNYCTSGDDYIAHIRSNYGKNAAKNAARDGGVSLNFNGYETNHADSVSTDANAQQQNLKTILGNALGGFVGDAIQAKKDGQPLPTWLDKVAGLGIKTEQAAISAASDKAVNIVGSNTLKFSPYIIGGLVAGIILLIFMMKK